MKDGSYFEGDSRIACHLEARSSSVALQLSDQKKQRPRQSAVRHAATQQPTSKPSTIESNRPRRLTVPMAKLLLHLVKLGELSARAERRVDLRGAVEQRVIHFVALPLFRVRDHRLEPVPPEYLLGQVARPGLSRLASGLDCALEDGHDLEPLGEHVLGGHIVQRGVGVDLVDDRRGPDEEQVTVLAIRAHGQLLLVLGQQLALLGRPGTDHLRSHGGPYDMALPHVPDAEHEAQLAVPLADDRVPRE